MSKRRHQICTSTAPMAYMSIYIWPTRRTLQFNVLRQFIFVSGAKMSQNIYDREDFFTSYAQFPRSAEGLGSAPEWPTLENMIGSVSGLRVLDLGCGYGYFSRWASDAGADSVTANDLSERMLARARELSGQKYPSVVYAQEDLSTFSLSPSSYDLVFSSLTFHYLPDIPRLIKQISQALAPGGKLVFSAEHPIFTSPKEPDADFFQHENGSSYWPLNGYGYEGQRQKTWLVEGVKKYHWTIETYVTALIDAGLTIKALKEWVPSEELIEKNPNWRVNRERPMFLLISATK
jgi:SAM-dependent methyltransferase